MVYCLCVNFHWDPPIYVGWDVLTRSMDRQIPIYHNSKFCLRGYKDQDGDPSVVCNILHILKHLGCQDWQLFPWNVGHVNLMIYILSGSNLVVSRVKEITALSTCIQVLNLFAKLTRVTCALNIDQLPNFWFFILGTVLCIFAEHKKNRNYVCKTWMPTLKCRS